MAGCQLIAISRSDCSQKVKLNMEEVFIIVANHYCANDSEFSQFQGKLQVTKGQ